MDSLALVCRHTEGHIARKILRIFEDSLAGRRCDPFDRGKALALEDRSLALGDPRLAECERLAMVLGTEGAGLFPSTIAACDYTVKIPMAHGVDSLNVAAASAVAFWELRAR